MKNLEKNIFIILFFLFDGTLIKQQLINEINRKFGIVGLNWYNFG